MEDISSQVFNVKTKRHVLEKRQSCDKVGLIEQSRSVTKGGGGYFLKIPYGGVGEVVSGVSNPQN